MRRFAACLLATVLICGLVPPAMAAGSGPGFFDMKYTLDIAALFVSPSDAELEALSESAEVFSNMNSLSDTLFGDALRRSITASDSAVNKAVTGVDLTAFTLTAIIDCNNFSYQYNNKSKTAVRALKSYCPDSLLREFGRTGSIESYLKDIEAETGTAFITKKLFVEDVLPKLIDSVMSSGSLGPAAALFAGWNFLAGVLPPIKNSIDSADHFQLANHAVYYQDDSQELQLKALASCFFPDHIDEEKLLAASDSAFTYLKFCYIARSSTITSLQLNFLADSGVKSTVAERADAINAHICECLEPLSQAQGINSTWVNKNDAFGLLPLYRHRSRAFRLSSLFRLFYDLYDEILAELRQAR